MTASTNTATVLTNASTAFVAKTRGDLKSGDTASVLGTKQADGNIVATKVESQ